MRVDVGLFAEQVTRGGVGGVAVELAVDHQVGRERQPPYLQVPTHDGLPFQRIGMVTRTSYEGDPASTDVIEQMSHQRRHPAGVVDADGGVVGGSGADVDEGQAGPGDGLDQVGVGLGIGEHGGDAAADVQGPQQLLDRASQLPGERVVDVQQVRHFGGDQNLSDALEDLGLVGVDLIEDQNHGAEPGNVRQGAACSSVTRGHTFLHRRHFRGPEQGG